MISLWESFYIIGAALLICYSTIIGLFCIGWILTPTYHSKRNTFKTKVSIIIAARNEEKNISSCLEHILKQDFPAYLTEIIVIDDNSEDKTSQIVTTMIAAHKNISLLPLGLLNNGNSFKKQAIKKGIENSTGELIITTDADCVMDKHWLSTLVSYYEEFKPEMIIGPVTYHRESSMFEKMQSLEFGGLILSGGGSAHCHSPILCNGANLAYTRSAYIKTGGFEDILQNPSGDDVLLMLKFSRIFKGKVHFLKSLQACVYTLPAKSIIEFMHQRSRWASKGFKNVSAFYKFTALVVFFLNFLIVVSLLFSVSSVDYFVIFGFLFFGKCLFDFLLLFLAASFFKKKVFLIYYFPEQMIYSFYVIVSAVSGIFKKYKWKGRRSGKTA